MKIQRLKNHWMIKKVGLKYLKTKRKFKKSKTVILMINKVGLLQIITLKKWQKLTLHTLRKNKQPNNQPKIKYLKDNKMNNKLKNKKNFQSLWSVPILPSKTYQPTWELNSFHLMVESFLQSEGSFGNATCVGSSSMLFKIK